MKEGNGKSCTIREVIEELADENGRASMDKVSERIVAAKTWQAKQIYKNTLEEEWKKVHKEFELLLRQGEAMEPKPGVIYLISSPKIKGRTPPQVPKKVLQPSHKGTFTERTPEEINIELLNSIVYLGEINKEILVVLTEQLALFEKLSAGKNK